MSFADTMARRTPLVLRSWSRSQETVSATATLDSHFGVFVLFRAKYSNKRTKERTNKQTQLFRFVLVLPWIHHAAPCIVPRAVTYEGGDSKLSLVFSKTKTHFSDCEGCPHGFVGVRGGRTTTISCSRMRSDNARNSKQRRQRLRALISLYSGQTTRIWMA